MSNESGSYVPFIFSLDQETHLVLTDITPEEHLFSASQSVRVLQFLPFSQEMTWWRVFFFACVPLTDDLHTTLRLDKGGWRRRKGNGEEFITKQTNAHATPTIFVILTLQQTLQSEVVPRGR
jgi:hypothetical protein